VAPRHRGGRLIPANGAAVAERRTLDPTIARALLRAARARLTPRPGTGAGAPEAPVVSAVIPVLDGGPRYVDVVDCLLRQRLDGPVEVLIADSGSTDGATDVVVARHPAVRVFDVAPEDFDHGRVRAGLVLAARAPLVAILSADALPLNDGYLSRLAEAFAEPQVAAVHARQVPGIDADPLVREALLRWTPPADEVGPGPHLRAAPPPEFWDRATPTEAMAAARLDNVASMVRRDVALAIPFPPRTFGEDVSWGRLVATAGWTLGYAPLAIVEHHHAPTVAELFSRNRRSHRQAAAEFGVAAVPTPVAGVASLAAETVGVARAHGTGWAARTLPRRAAALAGQWLGGREGRWAGPTGPVFAVEDAPPEGDDDGPVPVAVVMPAVAGSPHVAAALETIVGNPAVAPRAFVVSEEAPTVEGIETSWVEVAAGASYAARANAGFAAAEAAGIPRVVLLNDDVDVLRDGVDRLAEALRDPTVGIAGAVLLEWDDGAVQHGGIAVAPSGRIRVLDAAPDGGPPCDRDALSGAAMAMTTAVWRRLGGFDEGFTHFFEDVDLCLRARRLGLRSVLVPAARIRHRGGGTRGHREPGTARLLGRNHARFARRLPGGGLRRGLRLLAVGAAGLGWSARACGPVGVGAFVGGFVAGSRGE